MKWRDCTIYVAKLKSTDQLRSAPLFLHMQKAGFIMTEFILSDMSLLAMRKNYIRGFRLSPTQPSLRTRRLTRGLTLRKTRDITLSYRGSEVRSWKDSTEEEAHSATTIKNDSEEYLRRFDNIMSMATILVV